MNYFKWYYSNIRGIRANIIIRIAAGIVQAVLDLYVVWLSKVFVDVVIPEGSNDDFFYTVLWLFLATASAVLIRQFIYYFGVKANTRQLIDIKTRIYQKLFSTPLFSSKTLHSGDVSSRLSKDIELVSEVSSDILPKIIVVGVEFLGAFLLMRYFDARLAWFLALVTPLIMAIGKLIAFRLRKLTRTIRDEESQIQMQVQESVEQNTVLRSLCAKKYMTETLASRQDTFFAKTMRRTRFLIIIKGLTGLTFGLGFIAAFVYGGIQLKAGAITFGTLTSFLQLVGLIQSPILTLMGYLPKVAQSTASIDRLNEIESSSEEDIPTLLPETSPIGINFQNVTFKYTENGETIIKKFSHNFAPQSKTAITGRTGIGKTTLFRLMMAFIKPEDGQITIYNSSKQMSTDASLRANFVFVPQGNTLISGTIRFNLLIADPSANDQKLKQVLHTACADFVFDLKDGIDTILGEHGSGLSEGQAQRIAIARGLLRPGNIFLLDEISSALDTDTEKELYRRLFEAYPQKTMIFITHREAVESWCNQWLSME
ncbi:MAG: ABC transporter ATP-binding protein [Bacteroidales bacterium]|nr:ABC transporter ATP-binding protein [Bacteroidales bacterium]